jgi:endonuclease IV
MSNKEIMAYAIQFDSNETVIKTKEFVDLFQKTGCIGVHPDFPHTYALYLTKNKQLKAFKEYSKVFEHCKIVANIAYIPAQ